MCQLLTYLLLTENKSNNYMYSRRKKNGDAFVSFHPVKTEVKRLFPMHGMGGGRRDGNAVDYSNRSQHENDTSRAYESQKKHRSIQAITFGDDQSRLAAWDRSIVNSRLQTQSSLNCRTCSKSKSSSSELPQNNLEDHSGMKLSILVGESTSWPSFFCTSKDHTQLLIMHACIWNGNGTAGMNGTTASEQDRAE